MHKIVALYKFCKISDPSYFQKVIKAELSSLNILGTIIISEEGINGTISGTESSLNKALLFLKANKVFQDLDLKESSSAKKPFLRLKIKIKEEIVSMGLKKIDPITQAGKYIDPEEWNGLINDKNTILIDTRNNYECSIGSFKNAINPKTNNFKEFPDWVARQNFNEVDKKSKNFAMYCTGGIRCEKASSYMKNQGFKNVFHLKGGILKYLEKIDLNDSNWNGECFVFDDRVSVKHDLSEGIYDLCHGCRTPITEQDKLSSKYVKGVSCHHCINEKTTDQVNRYKSRLKQINLAKTKNEQHLGPKPN
jgi:UPF0176 protein